jgi:hypothetical protein
MSTNSAYPNEMNEVALFTEALRAAVPAQPSRELTATLVPRLAATARSSTIEAETRTSGRTQGLRSGRPRSRRALVARVAIAVALIPLLLAGLAVAGVTVPSPARSAFDSVGIHLPNQPKDTAEEGTGAPGSQPSTQGTATPGDGESGESGAAGQGKSEAAHEKARSERDKAKGKAVGHDRGKAIGLKEATPPGHSGQTGPPAHSNAGGNAGGSSGGGSSAKPPKTKHTPKGVAKGHTKVPPGRSK